MMPEEETSGSSGSSSGLILIGLATAGIILFITLKSKQQQSILTTSQSSTMAAPALMNLQDRILQLERHLYGAEVKPPITPIEPQVFRLEPEPPVITPLNFELQPEPVELLQTRSPSPISTFKNNEETVVMRDADGFIINTRRIRDAQKVADATS